MDYAPLQQTRIAALVPPATPGPTVVVKPVIGKPVAQPALPRAGKRFSVTFRITRSDNGTAITSVTTLRSTTVLAGKVVAHVSRFSAGQLKITLQLPKAAKGKQLKITVRVTADNQTATKVVTYKVR